MEKVVGLIREGALAAGTDRSEKVLEFQYPEKLQVYQYFICDL